MSWAQDTLQQLLGIAGDYVKGGGIKVAVKTNYGPELTVWQGQLDEGEGGASRSSGVLSGLLGLQTAIVVRKADGTKIVEYGDDYPATSPLRLALLLALLAGLGFVIYRGITK